jgi:hypothetical protein
MTLRPVARRRRALRRAPRGPVPAAEGQPGAARARSHCRFVPPRIHFIPDSLTYSGHLFLKRQCDSTLGATRHDHLQDDDTGAAYDSSAIYQSYAELALIEGAALLHEAEQHGRGCRECAGGEAVRSRGSADMGSRVFFTTPPPPPAHLLISRSSIRF